MGDGERPSDTGGDEVVGVHTITEEPQVVDGDWLTRKQVADLLGVSVFKVRSLEGQLLHPRTRADGANIFAKVEVNAILPNVRQRRARSSKRPIDERTEGEIAAEVFRLLDAHKDLRAIVIEARVPPARVRALYAEWLVPLADGERRDRQREREELARRREAKEQKAQDDHERRMAELDRSMAALFRRPTAEDAKPGTAKRPPLPRS